MISLTQGDNHQKMQKIAFLLIPGLIAITMFIAISSYENITVNSNGGDNLITLDYKAYSEGINTVLYDSTGRVNYTLRAENQIHFDDDHSELAKPFIRLFQEDGSRWNIIANSGRISADLVNNDLDGRTIELTGNVEVFSLDEFGNRTKMSTEFLQVNPKNETLQTDQAIMLITSNLQQSSIGMFADLKIDEIIFHQNIRGYYGESPK